MRTLFRMVCSPLAGNVPAQHSKIHLVHACPEQELVLCTGRFFHLL